MLTDLSYLFLELLFLVVQLAGMRIDCNRVTVDLISGKNIFFSRLIDPRNSLPESDELHFKVSAVSKSSIEKFLLIT